MAAFRRGVARPLSGLTLEYSGVLLATRVRTADTFPRSTRPSKDHSIKGTLGIAPEGFPRSRLSC